MPGRFTGRRQMRFLEVLGQTGSVREACAAVGISRKTAYEYRNKGGAFAERWNDLRADLVEVLEAECDRRALKGVLEPVFYQGAKVGSVRRFSDVLLMFRLKGLKPEMYRENASIEVAGKGGGPIVTRNLVVEELLKLDSRELARLHSEALALSDPAQRQLAAPSVGAGEIEQGDLLVDESVGVDV